MDEFTALFSRKDMTFEEAVAYFKERVPVTASRFYQIAAEYRALAFTVSGYTKAQVLKKFYDELLAALEDGNSLAEFRENMNDFLEAEGYEGITPYQAENIFRTNIQMAYNVGHYKRMTEPGVKELRPYWQYDAVNDSKTRPSHLAMDGRVFMADDPIWDTWFPPNGFKCRCTVKTLSKRQMEQRGLTVETEAPRAARLEDGRFVNILPDPQFDTNPAKVRYTFIDNLTGGKLSEIREKFSTAMSNIVQGISQKFTDARTAFSNGLNNIKNAVSGAVTWFFESGKRIVSTFANGIKSAFSSAVEAVKGGLQKIRNLLPFSDAKEGPLSTLTLSGQRTMTTYAHGLTLAGDAPAEAMNKSLQQMQGALDREPEKKVDLGGGKKDKDESSDEGGSGKGKQVIIHKLLVPVDLKKIKDLQQLLAILQEVEDYAAANEDGEPGDDEDAVPAPA